jgi:DNA-binding Xre family transcriptional regulator
MAVMNHSTEHLTEDMGTEEGSDIRSLIERLMEVMDLNQKQFSERWGVSEATVSKILTGIQGDITLRQARRLCRAFGVNPRLLFREPNGQDG